MSDYKLEYSDKDVTAWGGMHAMKEMMQKIKLDNMFADLDLPQPGSNRGYQPKDVIEAFMVSMWCGASRFTHSSYLRYDPTIQEIFGWKSAPSQSTYSRFFKKFTEEQGHSNFLKQQSWFMDNFKINNITIDMDSTVLTRYGKQEGAEKGYNPHKPGRKSHHPLMAFSEEGKFVVNATMRPGNTGAATGFSDFLDETIQILGDKKIGLLRADSGFYSNDNLDKLEKLKIEYIISAKKRPEIRYEIGAINEWVPLESSNGTATGIELGEMNYMGGGWKKPRRMVVVRQSVIERPDAQGKIFPDLPGYKYSVMITNTELPAIQVWRLYRGRADCENRIKELKQDFGLGSFSLKDFTSTKVAYGYMVLAYNLMTLFSLAGLKSKSKKQGKTIRFKCYAIAGWISKHARDKVLKLAVPIEKRAWHKGILLNISAIAFPIALNSIT